MGSHFPCGDRLEAACCTTGRPPQCAVPTPTVSACARVCPRVPACARRPSLLGSLTHLPDPEGFSMSNADA